MRPIDADALHFPVDKRTTGKTAWDYGVLHAKEIIDRAPIVDAVVVTRCKDCTNYNKLSSTCENRQWETAIGWSGTVNPDDYCSYAERKVDGE